ncbi:MAG: multicopper oxidase family protein [Silvibacterium sp.]
MNRREFIAKSTAAAALGVSFSAKHNLRAQAAADVRLQIAPLKLEIAPGKHVESIAYNGQVPGPLIRWPEGKPIAIDVLNRTSIPEIVHWHGLWTPSEQDGAMEEGSPMIAPGAQLRYDFTPRPSGLRWYHTHTIAGHNLKRGLYSGQFGCFYIEPKNEPGAYDQEIFLTLHDWNAYMGAATDASMDASYDYSTINDRMLGHGIPIRVKQNQRVIFRIVNASATVTHWLALAGHEMTLVAMDGNPVPNPINVTALRLAPAERADVVVEMKNPGVWILGETRDDIRKAGMGIVIEYAAQQGEPKWIDPPEVLWEYRPFAHQEAAAIQPDHQIPLLFESKFRGHGDFDYWTINGKSYPKTDTVMLQEGKCYRLAMRNKSADDHPIHLHRHTFEVTSLDGKPMSGLRKDVVVVTANSTAEVDFVAANPGATLFHCHQQSHMDFGFMMLFRYS